MTFEFYFDRDARPITSERWMELKRDASYWRVGLTDLGRRGRVSTVWLGLNHAFDDGPPLIFETLVFGGPLAVTMERYTTLEQARAGHEVMVRRVSRLRVRPFIHNGGRFRG